MKKFLIILLIISSISIPFAAAHPFTEETIPSLTSSSPTGVTEVIVYFSEPVEINFSILKVLDSNGSQIDNKDTSYYEGEESLVVTTSPLEDGVYTVSTKVLSKIDGHLVPDAFLFTIGNVVVDPALLGQRGPSEIVFLPEAGARFPGLVGQTIVLGAVIASLIIWGTQNKQLIREELDKIESFHHGKFMSITGIGCFNFCFKHFDDYSPNYQIRNFTHRCNSNQFWHYMDSQNEYYSNFTRNLVLVV